MVGGHGDDRLLGGAGHLVPNPAPWEPESSAHWEGDVLTPGPGSDLVFGGDLPGRDFLDFRQAERGLTIRAGQHVAFGQGRDRFVGVETIKSSAYDDRIFAWHPRSADPSCEICTGGPVLFARAGDDELVGNATFLAGYGDDVIRLGRDGFVHASGGNDRITLVSHRGDRGVWIRAGGGRDLVDLTAGHVFNAVLVYGGSGDDVVLGGAARDRVHGGADSDLIQGGENDDFLSGRDGEDAIDGGDGTPARLRPWSDASCRPA